MSETTEQPTKVKRFKRELEWIDANPRVGWFIASLSVLNVLLNTLDLTL